ncbi:dual specificity mitogen-activated protein kinase kinase 7-like [Planococcus citri]|uniref:dual specificity mitogen-activated protein kinase kinase 7-like n=1 Tax=Planococcus citri TaxID=170843 RepID=UPI0031FA42C3
MDFERRIMNLQARLRAENEDNQRENPLGGSPSHGPGRRPKQLGDIGTPTRTRKHLELPFSSLTQLRSQDTSEVDTKMKEIMKMNGSLNINGTKFQTDIKDLEHLGELGNGTCGHVVKMLHKPSNTIIAVKQMRRSGNSDENKRIIMDLDVVFKSLDCPYIVRYLGCFITESDVWICMELMATCFDRLLKKLKTAIPEDILGKVTLATVKALHYLKESHGVIHRDVKPSNILLDEKGNVKLCDFGISGRLVDSKAKTKNAGCAAYMAPERIEPPDPRKPDYDIRADVWSLGITLVELATGVFPYKDCKCDFEVLSRVLHEDPPSLPSDSLRFSPEFQSFVSSCLTKDYSHRPKYKELLEHPFLKRYELKNVDVAAWYAKAVSNSTSNTPLRYLSTSLSSSTRRQPPPPPPTTSHQSRRTGLENIVLNGDHSGKYSPFRSLDAQYGVNGLQFSEWDPHKFSANKFNNASPLLRRRYPPESSTISANNYNNVYGTENTSPLVLQKFHYQPNYNLNNHLPSYPITSSHYRSASLSPSRRYLTESVKFTDESKILEGNNQNGSKKKFSSYLKFHLNPTTEDVRRSSPPTVPSPAPPSPPPRYNRLSSNSSSPANFPSSPLMMRRNFYEPPDSPLASRRLYIDGSPLLSRRYVSPCPPQPPPRRLSESSSVPGSPQHYNFQRNDLIRNTPAPNKFQYTPQPQRKTIYQINDL